MLEKLKEEVLQANLMLVKHNLITFTWGNVSGIDEDGKYMVIKPSGVDYDKLTASDMVVVDLKTGVKVEGNLNPSSDTPTHLEIYKNFKGVKGVVHTHSRWATCFAQAGANLVALGTTHADYFYGDIPCTRDMKKREIRGDYEKATGTLIVKTFKGIDPLSIPAVLVKNHGPFAWGTSAYNAVHNAVILEEIAFMNYHTQNLKPDVERISKQLLNKHYLRKHGKNAYYGQNKK